MLWMLYRLIAQGYIGTKSRPIFSSKPQAMLKFWTAWPAAPLTRLSMAESTITRYVRSSMCQAMSQKFEPRTSFVDG